ncbi:MAG: CinA family protein, partial [Rikenellaceae bacterium]|nr:CinA family protein [Rikenellaceae bacterium]
MTASIITIGDELLIGQVVDTNSARIGTWLNGAGIVVADKHTVGDDPGEMREAIDTALRTHDLVITTGGIGPTRDDKTKEVVTALFGCGFVRDEAVYRHIEAMTAARGFAFNELNKAQADVPSCATVLHNENGTAPGLWLERDGHILVVLPGVPFETEALMVSQVLPRLRALAPGGGIVHRTMITSGIGESVLAERIAAWEDALPSYIKLAYLPSPSGVRLRLSAYNVDFEAVGAEIDERFAALEKLIPGHVMGYGEQTVESYVARLLSERGATLAVAESCTGGAIASRFTAIAGASEYFMGGVV